MPSFVQLLTIVCVAASAVVALPQAETPTSSDVSDGLVLEVLEVIPAFNGVEVVPGPGLPSLATVGLSSAGLWDSVHKDLGAAYALLAKEAPSTKRSLKKRSTAQCTTVPEAPLYDVLMCTQYLRALGDTTCSIQAPADSSAAFGVAEFCSFGNAKVWGQCPSGNCSQEFKCQDVAIGLEWVYDNCLIEHSTNDLKVSGTNTASGNANVQVFIEGI